MHHPSLRSRLIADLSVGDVPMPLGIARIRAYGNHVDLLVSLTPYRRDGDGVDVAKVFECVDTEFCARLVARWLAARAMRSGTDSAQSLVWADAIAAEIVRRSKRAADDPKSA